MRLIILAVLSLSLAACGTPQSVRQLSDQQTAHIETAIELLEAENEALRRYAMQRRDEAVAEYQRIYQDFRDDVPEIIREVDDPDQIGRPLDLLDQRRAKRDEDIAAINAQYDERVQALESRVNYMRAILLAQQQLDRAIDRDDPLTRMSRRVIGNEQYTSIEGRLNDLQTAWRENEDGIADIVSAATGDTNRGDAQ